MAQPANEQLQTLTTQILAGMQEWRMQHPKATFREIETEVDARLAELRARMLQATAQTSAAADWQAQPLDEQPHCPDCEQPLTRRGAHTRRLRSHHNEEIALQRQYGTCSQCGRGFFPLDEELALPPGQLTPLLREWVVHLGSWVPFVQVPALLSLFAQLRINRETARRQSEAAGALLVAVETAAAGPLAPPADPGPDTDERLQVSADGAMVRLKNGEWVEVKTVAVGRVGQRRARDGLLLAHSSQISYFSRHASAEEFTRLAVVELHRRGVRRAKAVAGVMDGATWLQGFLDYHRPDAVRILDLPHAAEHLGKLAVALGEEGQEARQWQAEQLELLREQGAGALLATLRALAEQHEQNASFGEHAEYLRRREEQMAYARFRQQGWPIGSGMVESGNKVVVEARLKGAGMGWAEGSLNPMLALRNAVCNDRWGESWATIWAGQQTEQHGKRGGRRQVVERAAVGTGSMAQAASAEEQAGVDPQIVAEVEAILGQVATELAVERAQAGVVNGKPGPGHRWRHSPIGRPR